MGMQRRVRIGIWMQGIHTIGVRLNANFRFRGMMGREAGESAGVILRWRGGVGVQARRLIVVIGK